MTGLEGDKNLVPGQTDAGESLRQEAAAILHAEQPRIAHQPEQNGNMSAPSLSVPRGDTTALPNVHLQDSRRFTASASVGHSILGPPVESIPHMPPQPIHTSDVHEHPKPATDGTQPAYYTVKSVDNLWKIARAQLKEHGLNADNTDVAKYVRQIETDNPMHNPNLIMPGQILKIRDYRPSASPVTPPKYFGNMESGLLPLPRHDVKDNPAQVPPERRTVIPVEQDRQRLIETARKHGDDVYQDTQRFENVVMKRLEDNLVRGGMSADKAYQTVEGKIIGTYKEAERIYEAGPADRAQAYEFRLAARQIIHNAAHAGNISQGEYGTCAATSVESMMYKTEPEKAAKLVADVVLTGQYTTHNGKTIKVDTTPYGESVKYPMQDGKRNYASQLFQVTATNLAWRARDPSIRYEQRKPLDHDRNHPSGEYLLRNGQEWLHKDGKTRKTPEMTPQDVAVMYSLISGKSEKAIVLESGSGSAADKGIVHTGSEEDLEVLLKNRKEAGKLPLVAAVDAYKKPFSLVPKPGVAGHVVLIVDYMPARNGQPAMLIYDNSWGRLTTRKEIPVSLLYNDLLPLPKKS